MLFSLYDTKTDCFGPIFEAPERFSARRMFMELLNSPRPNQITQYIDDYVLYEMGDFDNTTGKFLINRSPVHIVSGLEIVKEWKERKKLLKEIYITPSPSGDEESTSDIDVPSFMKGDNEDECREQKGSTDSNIVSIRQDS